MAQQREEEIDLLVLTAVDLTHARHVPQLLERVPVRSLVLPEQVHNEELRDTILQLAREQGTERLSPAQAEEYLPGLRLDGSVATKLTVEYEGDGVGLFDAAQLDGQHGAGMDCKAPRYRPARSVCSRPIYGRSRRRWRSWCGIWRRAACSFRRIAACRRNLTVYPVAIAWMRASCP